jgi:hypothetical protein
MWRSSWPSMNTDAARRPGRWRHSGPSAKHWVVPERRRFGYYHRLSPKNQAVYRRSDAVTRLPLQDPAAARPWIGALRAGLVAADRHAVQWACNGLCAQLCVELGVSVVHVRVLARRPVNPEGELHGLYLQQEDGTTLISVWMRTAAYGRVVAFRTFLRTLLHELCHHFDFEYLRLRDSYHTRGFFQRESSLVRQLVPTRGRRRRAAVPRPSTRRPSPRRSFRGSMLEPAR